MIKRIAAIAALAVLGTVSAFAGKPVQPPPPPGPLLVVDSTGKIVGRLGSDLGPYTDRAKVFMMVDGSLVAVEVAGQNGLDSSKLYFRPTGGIYFEGTTCAGTAYALPGDPVAFGVKQSKVVDIGAGRMMVYIASGPLVTMTLSSAYRSGECIVYPTITQEVNPLSAGVDLTAQYLQPFVIQ